MTRCGRRMNLRSHILLVAVGLHLSAMASSKEQVAVGVMEFVGKEGVSQDTVDVLADLLATEISQMGDVRVIGQSDIMTMLAYEKQKRLAGCTSKECISEIGGALGVRWMVGGNLSLFGTTYLLNLKLFDTERMHVISRISRKIKGDKEELLDAVPEAAHELFVGVGERIGLVRVESVTIAARHPQLRSQSPSAITVITREQIKNTACTDLMCLLRQVPEVDAMRVLPFHAVIGSRLLNSEIGDKVLVLVDGIEVIEEVFGIPFWQALQVHLEDIERVEVIRGPGSALYGANAHSVIVSIKSRQATENKGHVFIGGGEHGRVSLHLKLDQRFTKRWSLQLSGSEELGDHWRIQDHRDREVHRIRLRLARESGSSTSLLQAGLVTATIGKVFTKLGVVSTRDPLYMGHLLLSHKTDVWKIQAYFRASDMSFWFNIPLYFRGNQLGKMPEELEAFSSYLDAEFQINWSPWKNNLLLGGANYRWITYLSEDNRPNVTHQHRIGVFLQDEQRIMEDVVLTGGVRCDYNNISPFVVSPRLAAVWRFLEGHRFRLAFGMAFRKPSFLNTSIHIKNVEGISGIEEFFERSLGNDGLDNESVVTIEAGYVGRYFDRRLTAEADVFHNRYRDTINFHTDIALGELGMPDLRRSTMEYRNEGMDVDSIGGSVSLTYHVGGSMHLNLNYTFRHSWFVSEPSGFSAVAGEEKGNRVPRERAHLFNASAYYLSESGPRFGANLHVGSSADAGWTKDGSPFGESIMVHFPPVFFVNAFAAWRQTIGDRWWELGIRAYNVFHTSFRDTAAVTQPDGSELGGQLIGRRVFVFLRSSF